MSSLVLGETKDKRTIARFLTLEDDFNTLHKGRYIYTEAVYTGVRNKITIICKLHGKFEQVVHTHLKGSGCPECKRLSRLGEYKLNQDAFVEKATHIHEGKYSYNLVEYKGSTSYIEVLCVQHGSFKVNASEHLRGSGCPTCGVDKSRISKSFNKQYLLSILPEKLLNLSFEEVPNILWKQLKIPIICREHGVFYKSVERLLKSEGCPKCVALQNGLTKTTPLNVWLNSVQIKHNNLYTYPINIYTYYKNGTSKVPIVCKEHGVWFTSAKAHLAGSGCPECNSFSRNYYIGKETLFYIIKYKGLYKIGITTKPSVRSRYSSECNWKEVELLFTKKFTQGEDAYDLERYLIRKYYIYRYNGVNIFNYTGNTEVFTLNVGELEQL